MINLLFEKIISLTKKGKFLFILQIFIILFHFVELNEFFNSPRIIDTSSFNYYGNMLIISGLIMLLISVRELGNNFSPFPEPKQNGILITSGIYRIIRHPIYFSLLIISFGFFINKLIIYYLLLFILLFIILKIKISIEEKEMSLKFSEYKKYVKNRKF